MQSKESVLNICLIYCHPNPKSLNAAIADAYERGACRAGHEVRRFDLYALDFDPSLYRSPEGERQPLEPDLVEAQKAIEWANHIVFVFPVWWAGLPARLKGFFDRTLLTGWAFRYREKGILWDKLLKGRSARAIYTMDTPPWIGRWFFGDLFWRELKARILGFVGIAPVRRTVFGPVKGSRAAVRERWLSRVEALGARGA